MARYDFDLFTIGAGSGGVRASRIARGYGARVAIAEERHFGGTCVNVGCIPKKLFVYAAEFSEAFADSAGFGWTVGERRHDWKTLLANKNREIARLNGIYERLLREAGVEIFQGRAVVLDPHTVAVNGRRHTTEHILVACGSRPAMPGFAGVEHALSSDDAFFLEELPASALIVGGGYIAAEFATIFHGLGMRVTIVHRRGAMLRGFDDDVRTVLGEELQKRGLELRLSATVTRLERIASGLRVHLDDGATLDTGLVLCATGRQPNTRAMGLEETGVRLDADAAVVVDKYSRSSVPNIHAIGDCTNRVMLTPVAIAEGMAVADTMFGPAPRAISYENIPSAVFSHPSVGAVGLTEEQARLKYAEVDIYKTRFRPLKHTLSGRDETTFMKLVVDARTQRVLGCHMVGAEAGEIIQGLAIALNCGATKAQFDATIALHPTAAEEFVTMRQKAA